MPRFLSYYRQNLTPDALRRLYVDAYYHLGGLYAVDYDWLEARHIREELELLGVPMGYGRVGKAPSVLAEEYWPAFGRAPNRF